MHRTLTPEITGAHISFSSEDTFIMPTTNYHTKKTKTVRESRGGWQHHRVVQAMTHSCPRLKHLGSISLRSTWWLLCKRKKATYFAVGQRKRKISNLLPSAWLQTTALSELSMVGIENRWLPHPCSGLFTTLITSSIMYKAIKG